MASTPQPGASAALRDVIANAGGSISVERFMREALYHPVHGYYTRRIGTVGRGGDFSTSATLDDALGQALARWAAHHRSTIRTAWGNWHLIELGGGNGALAAALIGSLGWRARRGLRYHIVEVGERLRIEQQQRLKGEGGRVSWHCDIRSATGAARGRALIFSNEFVDAFPCVQLKRNADRDEWEEVHLAWPDFLDRPVEEFRRWTAHDACTSSALDPRNTQTRAQNQRIEIHAAYRHWLDEELMPSWHLGRLLTIDYGDRMPELLRRRLNGTLRAYCRHQRFTGAEVYERFGQQDLTADVNFTDLQDWGTQLGLTTAGYGTQAEFLRQWLPPRKVGRAAPDSILARLLDLDGAGGAFKVLEQTRGPG